MTTVQEPIPEVEGTTDYYSVAALSHSGMKDLAVSPLRYWARWINPLRKPCEPTPEMRFGSAVHCLVLEGEQIFHNRCARMIDPTEYPGCLETIEDIRSWIRDKGFTPTGTRKAQLVDMAFSIDPHVQIWDSILSESKASSAGKAMFTPEDWERVISASNALLAEPVIADLLRNGQPEVPLFCPDPETGIPLKAKLDWLTDQPGEWTILDLKTFVQRRGSSIDKSIADAIYYEGYYRQAYFYSKMVQRSLNLRSPARVLMAFVESNEPHEVRIREFCPRCEDGTANLYWERARLEVRNFCSLWAEYMREFEERPWRRTQEATPLADEEMRAMVYAA